jgi:urease accessory protein
MLHRPNSPRPSETADSRKHQRSSGAGRIGFKPGGGETRLDTLFQEGCAKIRLPRVPARSHQEAVLINTSGGLTGGDRLQWSVALGEATRAVVTSQACERIYRASGGVARVESSVSIGPDADLAWLPQETILFDGGALERRLDIEMAPGSRLLAVEALVLGRQAMGEQVTQGHYRDRWRIRRSGRLIHAEDLALGPQVASLAARPAVLSGARALATVLLVAEGAERYVEPARALVGQRGGVSAWDVGGDGKLLARLVADSAYDLRRHLVPLIALLNGKAGVPKVWSI